MLIIKFTFGQIKGLGSAKGNSVFGKFVIPTIINSLTNIIKISAGFEHALFLDYYGNVHSVGNNSNGQLGLNDIESRSLPVIIPNFNLL